MLWPGGQSLHVIDPLGDDAKQQPRLANLDRNLKVLLIEAGESNLNNPMVFRPGIYPRNMKLDSKTATFYESRPSKWLSGRKAVVPCANILGGGSSINFMMYTRASASDVCPFRCSRHISARRYVGVSSYPPTIPLYGM